MQKKTIHQTVDAESLEGFDTPGADAEGRLLQIHPIDLDTGVITLNDQPFSIGRDERCQLTISNLSVSRQHSLIERIETGFQIKDLGSTNGTIVNSKKIDCCPLGSGDRIRIGDRIFKFVVTDKIEAHYHEVVYSMMTKDSLTDLWNKRYLIDVLKRDLKRCTRSKRSLGFIMLDLDHFKSINDKHGHLVGDEVLVEVASRIRRSVREEDIVARFGGEEFAILLSESDRDGAVLVGNRCLEAVSATPVKTTTVSIDCTLSIGVGIVDESNPLTMLELIQHADENLYKAKNAGRNCIRH